MIPTISVALPLKAHFFANCRSLFFQHLNNPHAFGQKARLETKFGKHHVGYRIKTEVAGRGHRISMPKARGKSTTRLSGFC